MESITLKELSAYLPFNVRYKDSYAGDISTRILNGNSIEHWKCGHIKPLILHLRPLSDLTKEIEVNGVRFIPVQSIRREYSKIDGSHRDFDYPLTLDGLSCGIFSLAYWVIEKLLEWHFDVFNLIDRGLAIDLNSI